MNVRTIGHDNTEKDEHHNITEPIKQGFGFSQLHCHNYKYLLNSRSVEQMPWGNKTYSFPLTQSLWYFQSKGKTFMLLLF